MTLTPSSPCIVIPVDGRAGAVTEMPPGAFMEVRDADVAVYVGAYLARHQHLSGLWWNIQPGYSPALVARDIATLSHLGRIEKIAVAGDHALEAFDVIIALLTDEPVSMSTPFGELVDAVNRPPVAYDFELCIGHSSDVNHFVSPHVTVRRP